MDASPAGVTGVYRLGDWPAPFAIVLVVDRLAALMVLLTSVLATTAVVFSLARWHRVGVLFHPLFQFLLMGVNGAFLTGDLFNLFVFVEILLAASYGLALHGSGAARVTAGMQYIVVNLAASLLFLIGVSLIYGVAGTLNMADLAARVPAIPAEDRAFLEAGAGILGIALLAKAGMWPLCFWLPGTYAVAPPPVASMFAILTKVGACIVLRLWLLLFRPEAAASAQFGGEWLLFGGMATMLFGTIGSLAAQDMARLAAFSVLVSSGTVLAAVGMGQPAITGAALFYLVSSTLGLSAFFLLVELAERGREPGADMIAVTRELYGEEKRRGRFRRDRYRGSGDHGFSRSGFHRMRPRHLRLAAAFGFIGKFALLAAALGPPPAAVSTAAWTFMVVLILAGLAAIVSLTRAGIHAFWASPERAVPRVRLVELAPVIVLLILCGVQTIQAGPVMRYMRAAAQSLHVPDDYIRGVLRPAAGQTNHSRGGA